MSDTQDVRRAAILSAGRGTRLGKLTADRPKPMIPVRGRPVLEWIIDGLKQAGIRELLLIVGYRAEVIEAHFGDGSAFGVSVQYARQPVANGTGAALALARDFSGGEPLLSSFGDILTDPAHYHALIAAFVPRVTATLGINPVDDPSAGAAVYREDDRVLRVVEKPPPGTAAGCWNLAGVYVFNSAVFDALERLSPSPRGEYELTAAIEALIEQGGDVRACEFRGFWNDIGSPASLAAAEREWTG